MSIKGKPTVSPTALQQSLKRVEEAVTKATDDKGEVNVKELERRLATTAQVKGKDVGADQTLDAVKDQFTRSEQVYVSSGCSGGYETRQHAPETLSKGEVKSVMAGLIDARKRAAAFDTNKDGKLSPAEQAAAAKDTQGTGLGKELAHAALEGVQQQVKDATTPATPKPAPTYSSGGCG